MSLIDDKCVLWNFFVSKVISSEKINNLRWSISLNLGGDTKFQSINPANIVVENVESVPVFFLINQVGVLLELINVVHDCWSIASLESKGAYNYHRDVCFCKSLTEWMSSFSK